MCQRPFIEISKISGGSLNQLKSKFLKYLIVKTVLLTREM